jgi:sugar phosphate isomerase/epimerase
VCVYLQNAQYQDLQPVVIAPAVYNTTDTTDIWALLQTFERESEASHYPAGAVETPQSDRRWFNFQPSVLTSSSPMSLSRLTQALSTRDGQASEIDVFLLRTRDILDMLKTESIQIDPDAIQDIAWLLQKKILPRHNLGSEVTPNIIIEELRYCPETDASKQYLKLLLERGYVSAIDILAFEDKNGNNPNIDIVRQCIARDLNGLKVSAFATYFPQIASERIDLRTKAVRALKNCMKLGMQMRKEGLLSGNDVIVEVVSGSFLDRTVQYGTGKDVIRVRHREQICDLVARSLVTAFQDAEADESCTFSMELEPGDCYLINNLDTVHAFLKSADKAITKASESINHDAIPISLNLDLGHYFAAGIDPNQIAQLVWDRFSHAHISYIHGRMRQHYRDLPIVRQRFTDQDWQVLQDYIERYVSEISRRKKNNRDCPSSGSISIELEGAPYFSWIEESLKTLCGLKPTAD